MGTEILLTPTVDHRDRAHPRLPGELSVGNENPGRRWFRRAGPYSILPAEARVIHFFPESPSMKSGAESPTGEGVFTGRVRLARCDPWSRHPRSADWRGGTRGSRGTEVRSR